MERKAGSVEVLVTEAVREALPKAKLSAEEEKVLRMRHGVALADPSEPLHAAAPAGSSVADELLLIEMELVKAQKRRTRTARATPPKLDRTAQKTREKIVRVLRKKK